jgi:serine/threonine protein kinase
MGSATTSPTTADQGLGDDASGTSRQGSRLLDPALPRIGHLLAGKYRIDGILGRGGMGVVAAGHQLNLDRPVAIKFLRHTLAETARQRFTREAMAVARIQSDHVVRVYDAGEENGLPFIVMERLVGNDLAEELSRGPLAPDVAVKYLLEACEALAEAHELGIVHRDLKPSNLYVTKGANGRRNLKVLDFGVSKWLDTAPDGETPLATADHGIIGTPAYVSPEQLTTPNAVDERSDIWSLGVVIHQCLSGKRPFEGRSVPQVCAAILAAPAPEFEPRLGVPDTLAAIVRRCLKKKPAERYQSVRELSEALAGFRTPRSVPERAFDALRGRGLVRWVALGAAIAVAVTLGVLFRAKVPEAPSAEPVESRLAEPRVDEQSSTLPAEPPVRLPRRAVESTPSELGPVNPPVAPPASAAPLRHAARTSERRAAPKTSKAEAISSVPVPPPAALPSAPVAEPPREGDAVPMYRR